MPIIRLEKNKHKGRRCFILGTGPGLNDLDMSLLNNEITIGMNTILRKKDITPSYLVVGDTTVLEYNWNTVWSFNNHYRVKDCHYVVTSDCNMRGTEKHKNLSGICTEGSGSTCSARFLKRFPSSFKIHTVKHEEKTGTYQKFFKHTTSGNKDDIIMTRLDEYYIDPELRTISMYGCTTMDALAVPTAVYLGCNEIYMIGTDKTRCHFYDSKPGHRHIEFTHVLSNLKKLDVRLYNADPRNAFPEVEYRKYEDLFKD